ncbi:cytochrome P450 [Actinosynnema mirum]|uniref:Cytochrome P450 n=1 Tax=Actinosynnema mirum (strain ATCC 29888 / DSM 43827 / JCM 3225 / NBRC 14064 / NCIMB 13271 / NRRL B-12336 / IMRU 3971 / 101) TaxID=446462 RepID=C6WBX9_ACTMD|nr:cytochrome P450 [Actinosynnema mirum]ACU37546.1 cytochrome P450 [Actinosynnema mirum DSM 43827]
MTTAEWQHDAEEIMHPRLPAELIERDSRSPFDPASGLTALSGQGPVHRVGRADDPVWLVTGHEEARTVLAEPRMSADRINSPRARSLVSPELHARMFPPERQAGSFVFMDAPEHTRFRRALAGQFTMRRMRDLTPRIHEIVTTRLDAVVEKGPPADLVPDFAVPLPSLAIGELLGVAPGDRDEFQRRTAALLHRDAPVEEQIGNSSELNRFMQSLVRAKKRDPGDDVLSGLARDTDLTRNELAGVANLLLIAGHSTTANMLALGAFALLEHPEELAKLRDAPELVENAVEELLRYLSIINMGIARHAKEDVVVGGATIRAGETVVVAAPAVNRDGDRHDDPHRLRVDRPRSHHVAFGHGVHQCLGQQLARVVMTVGFAELLRRLPTLQLAVPLEEVAVWTEMSVYGVRDLQVRW